MKMEFWRLLLELKKLFSSLQNSFKTPFAIKRCFFIRSCFDSSIENRKINSKRIGVRPSALRPDGFAA